MSRYIGEHHRDLLADLRPLAERTRDELALKVRELLEAERRWQTVATQHGEIVSKVDGASGRVDMPSQHGLEGVVADLRRLNVEIPLPAPHWAGRRIAENSERANRLIKLRRKPNKTEADETRDRAAAQRHPRGRVTIFTSSPWGRRSRE